MKCPGCQHENEAGAKFCEECATPLARVCAQASRHLVEIDGYVSRHVRTAALDGRTASRENA